jgi:hypothetical protein
MNGRGRAALTKARLAGRHRRRKLAGLGSAEEMLEPGGRDGYMLYETTFSERNRAP